MKILGLDLSLKSTGICLYDTNDKITTYESWVVGSGNKKNLTFYDNVMRLIEISNTIKFIVAEKKPDLIGIEGQSWRATGRIGSLGELHGVVKADLFRDGFTNIEVIPPASVRKIILGQGAGGVSKIKYKRFLKLLGLSFESDDIMDAWSVGMALAQKKGYNVFSDFLRERKERTKI